MTSEKFNEIWNIVLIPIVARATEESKTNLKIDDGLREAMHSKYEKMKEIFKLKFMKNPDANIDRHKIAALFYVAFIDVVKFNEDDQLFVHNIAFSTAIAILDNFICNNDETKAEYRSYVREHSISGNMDSYLSYIIKEIILASKENKLSVFLLANIFYLIERNSKVEFLKIKGNLWP